MAVREENRRGKRVLVLDIGYRKPDGSWARYRRDSEAATKTAAKEEERRIKDRIAKTGSPFDEPSPDLAAAAKPIVTFGAVVDAYRASFMVTDLKVTSRRGYDQVLDSVLLPRFKDRPVTKVNGDAATELDLELAKKTRENGGKLARSTRNNAQIVLRFAVGKKHLGAMPSDMPRLKRIGQTILEIPSDEEVERILAMASKFHRLSFTIMADAGLRPNEVRALRRRDVEVRREDGEPVGGFLRVREGLSYGQTDTPKTGQREIPLTRRLARLLGEFDAAPKDAYVALSRDGKPWGQYGLDQAFERVRDRAGLSGWSLYSLRHYAITFWLRRGIPVHVVQKMAGHTNLSTTQRYVHFLKADLEDAARRLAGVGNMLETAPGQAKGAGGGPA
jgi:integrase